MGVAVIVSVVVIEGRAHSSSLTGWPAG
jgi:hypothetical protein